MSQVIQAMPPSWASPLRPEHPLCLQGPTSEPRCLASHRLRPKPSWPPLISMTMLSRQPARLPGPIATFPVTLTVRVPRPPTPAPRSPSWATPTWDSYQTSSRQHPPPHPGTARVSPTSPRCRPRSWPTCSRSRPTAASTSGSARSLMCKMADQTLFSPSREGHAVAASSGSSRYVLAAGRPRSLRRRPLCRCAGPASRASVPPCKAVFCDPDFWTAEAPLYGPVFPAALRLGAWHLMSHTVNLVSFFLFLNRKNAVPFPYYYLILYRGLWLKHWRRRETVDRTQ